MPATKNTNKKQPSKKSLKVPPGQKSPKTTPAADSASYSDVCHFAKANAKKHGKSEKTNKQYDSYIERSRIWLATFETEGDTESNLFLRAFDDTPNAATPEAIAAFMSVKCFDENLGKSTAHGIHAAFKQLYARKGDRYRGKWDPDACTGNPCDSALVKDMLEACINKGNESKRNHSRAMTYEDMEALMAWSSVELEKARIANNIGAVCEWLSFRAFAATGFILWTRNCEATCLQSRHFTFNAHLINKRQTQIPFFQVDLQNRKGWQKKMQSTGGNLDGHQYNIYAQPKRPSICMYTHLTAWIEYMEKVLGRSLQDDDYVFPSMSANGQNIYPHTPISKEKIQEKLDEFSRFRGLKSKLRYTTHCFRRGGAQFRFMYAPIGEQWTLSRIRWWGGWAEGEHRDTLIRYLLDELYNYEESHSDALCPLQVESETSSHAREASDTRVFTLSDGMALFDAHTRKVKDAIQTVIESRLQQINLNMPTQTTLSNLPVHQSVLQPRTSHYNTITLPVSSPVSLPQGLAPQVLAKFLPFVFPPILRPPTPDLSLPLPTRSQGHRLIIPNISKGVNAWKQVINDWEQGDPARSLSIPLSQWTDAQIRKSQMGSKHNQRKLIATEFIDMFGRNEDAFVSHYGETTVRNLTALYLAIRQARQADGTAKTRKGKEAKR